MKEILRITIGLTLSCLVAAFVMGSVFAITDHAKKRNEHRDVQETMLSLLGYEKGNRSKPEGLVLHTFFRYNLEDEKGQHLGYLVPVQKDPSEGYELLVIDLEGNLLERIPVELSPEAAGQQAERKKALEEALPPEKRFTFSNATIVANLEGRRLAYILRGEFPGFKTFISVMLALNPEFDILGLEIMEHEEDPGLGAEIEEDYFKNQFKGKTSEDVKDLTVVKKPLPEEYRRILQEAKWKKYDISEKEAEGVRNQYRDEDIYALTGATISSRAVTGGVKNIAKKFAYRLDILEKAASSEGVPLAF